MSGISVSLHIEFCWQLRFPTKIELVRYIRSLIKAEAQHLKNLLLKLGVVKFRQEAAVIIQIKGPN